MSMHLHHPSLSMSGKKKGKQKFRNADEARKARDLAASWGDLQKKYASKATISSSRSKLKTEILSYKLSAPVGRGNTNHIPSLDTGGNATLAAPKIYTGTKVKGIATMHKSNAVPVFSDEEAIDISRMRR